MTLALHHGPSTCAPASGIAHPKRERIARMARGWSLANSPLCP